jgi:hypothetical protein
MPWDTLESAVGSCDHVPNALQGLLSSDASIRESSYWQLDNHVVVQGGLYEGAFYLIPFLLPLLEQDTAPGKEGVLDLLYELGNGNANWDRKVRFGIGTGAFYHFVPRRDGIEIPLAVGCRIAVGLGIETYLRLLDSRPESISTKSLELIGSFAEFGGALRGALQARLRSTHSEFMRKALLETLQELPA